jgi:hypothetical protein
MFQVPTEHPKVIIREESLEGTFYKPIKILDLLKSNEQQFPLEQSPPNKPEEQVRVPTPFWVPLITPEGELKRVKPGIQKKGNKKEYEHYVSTFKWKK